MPDLSDVASVRLQNQSLLHAMIGDPGLTTIESNYRRNFARLVDKAISRYQSSRDIILAQIEEAKRPVEEMTRDGRQLFILGLTDTCEDCINALHRALNLLDRIKSEPLSAKLPRDKRRFVEAHSREIPNIRNAVEHVDEQIQRGDIRSGQPVMLALGEGGDRIGIGAYEVAFQDLANALRKLHEIGLHMFETSS